MKSYFSDDSDTSVKNFRDPGVEPSDQNNPALAARLQFIQENVAKYRNNRKGFYRQTVLETKAAIPVYCEHDEAILLNIFPEEIWSMLFKQLDVETYRNSGRSCALFEKICQRSNHLKLLEKVLPFLREFLSRRDIYSCRLVCKKWLHGVNTYLQNLGRSLLGEVDTHYQNNSDDHDIETKFVYKVKVPTKNLTNPRSIHSTLHTKNPLISKAVILFGVDQPPKLNESIDEFLYKFGDYIWHAKLNYDSKGRNINKSASRYYSSMLQILRGCPNLKSVYLYDACSKETKAVPEDIKLLKILPPERKNLTCLVSFANHWNILPYQDNLLQKYSSQLKYLSVCTWNSTLYQNLNWNNLCELSLSQLKNKEELYNSLTQLKAPSLHKFSIVLPRRKDKLIMLMRVLHNFPKLQILKLEIESAFRGFLDKEILELPENLAYCPIVTDLTVIALFDKAVLFNFLICFPLVKKLRVLHSLFNDLPPGKIKIGKENFVDLVYRSHEAKSSEEVQPMYKSTIWEIMPYLEILEDEPAGPKYIYTRKGYEQQLSMVQKSEKILEQAKHEAVRQKQLKRKLLQNKLSLLRTEFASKKPKKRLRTKVSSSQILCLVLPYLDLKNILNCSKTCKSWRTVVGKALQGNVDVPKLLNPVTDIACLFHIRKFNIVRNFIFPQSKVQKQLLEQMRIDKPFSTVPSIGKNVTVTIHRVDNQSEQMLELELHQFFTQFGEHIHTLTLSGGEGTYLHPKTLSRITVEILCLCKNMRKLCLSRVADDCKFENEQGDYETLPQHDCLEELDCDAWFPKIGQEALARHYSRQIKSLVIHYLNASNGQWPLLTKLVVFRPYKSDAEIDKVKRWNWYVSNRLLPKIGSQSYIDNISSNLAPNLKTLHININGGYNDLLYLLLLTHRLPNLTTLEIEICKNPINCSVEQIADLTPGFVSSANLTCLDISCPETVTSYDFLYFFPFLRKLKVCENNVKYFNQMCFLNCVPEHRGWKKNKAWNAQQSIWEMLPVLHRVEAWVKWAHNGTDKSKGKYFIRV